MAPGATLFRATSSVVSMDPSAAFSPAVPSGLFSEATQTFTVSSSAWTFFL